MTFEKATLSSVSFNLTTLTIAQMNAAMKSIEIAVMKTSSRTWDKVRSYSTELNRKKPPPTLTYADTNGSKSRERNIKTLKLAISLKVLK